MRNRNALNKNEGLRDETGAIRKGTDKMYPEPALLNCLQHELDDSNKEISAYKFALDEAAIVAITDSLGIIRHANRNFCRISKYSAEELIGQDHRIINSGYHSKAFFRDLWSMISEGKTWKGEIKNQAKDGSFYWEYTTIIPFLDEHHLPYQYLAIRNDITMRKSAENEIGLLNRELGKKTDERILALEIANQEHEFHNIDKEIKAVELLAAHKELLYLSTEREKRAAELLAANQELLFQISEKEKRAAELVFANRELKVSEGLFKEINQELESFSYSVSHDLRAPLRAIHGYSKMLKTNFESVLDKEANRLVNKIVDNAKKMGQLIDDLLDFSRMSRKELSKIKMTMDDMVQDICDELKKENPDRNIEFTILEILPCVADNITMRYVWQNLISNAVKYTGLKENAKIEIGSLRQGNEVVYYVKDNGAGFDMRYADKLFGVFQRLHSEDEFEGTGVGLALTQRIILKHGGRIWADAEVDRGAEFYFTLNSRHA